MGLPENRIRLVTSARTDKGRVRQNNEDSIDLWEAGQFVLAVVADGMGGAAAGEEASRIAIETVRKKMTDDHHKAPDDYDEDDEDSLVEKLVDVVKAANLNIVERAEIEPSLKGMGTTMTLAFARKSYLTLVHVGDSRAYQVDGHDGSIRQLTADHSFVQALVDAGHITQEEAESHPMKNVLYRALGQDPHIDVDSYSDLRLHIGDRLVLCSDGLTLHVKPQEIAQVVMDNAKPEDATKKLLEMANGRGGKDNISVIVIGVENIPDGSLQDMIDQTAPDDDATVPINPAYISKTHDTAKLKDPDSEKPQLAEPEETPEVDELADTVKVTDEKANELADTVKVVDKTRDKKKKSTPKANPATPKTGNSSIVTDDLEDTKEMPAKDNLAKTDELADTDELVDKSKLDESDDTTPPIYNTAYGEGTDPSEPSQ